MGILVGWSLFVGLIWFVVFAVLQVLAVLAPDQGRIIEPIMHTLQEIGWSLGSFAKPLLQLAIVLMILLEAAKRLGFVSDRATLSIATGSILESKSIQAIIAIIIVSAVSISALAGIGDTAVLKDLALVVVGFYFGTKTKERDDAGDTTSPASAPAPPAAGPSSQSVERTSEDAWKANPGENWGANGPYLGRGKDPSNLDSYEKSNPYKDGSSGRRTH